MNFLAHSLLSDPGDDALIGNLAADFLSHDTIQTLSPALRPGVEKHWRIDEFTDEHAIFRQSVKRLQLKHVGGIVIDIAYDHFLATNWERFCKASLREFTHEVYRTLQARVSACPETMQRRIPYMIRDDWMYSYREKESVRITLERVSRRIQSGRLMAGAYEKVEQHYAELERDFLEFFPEAMREFGVRS